MRISPALVVWASIALLSCSKTTPGATTAQPTTKVPVAAMTEAAGKAGFQVPNSPLTAEDFTLPGLDDAQVSLKNLRGNVVLVNFWATWCPPCKAEIPSLEKLYSTYKSKGLRVLSIDVAETRTVVQKFVADNKMETTVLLDLEGKTAAAYGAQSIPLTYIVLQDGSVAGRTLGARDWGSPEVSALVETLLAAR